MIRTLLYHDHLRAAQAEKCQSTESEGWPLCVDIRNQLQRMRDSIPVLFYGTEEKIEPRLARVRESIYELLSARIEEGSHQDRLAQGRAIYEAAYGTIFKASSAIDLEKTIAERTDEATRQDPATSEAVNRQLRMASDSLRASLERLRTEFAQVVRKSATNICGLSYRDLTAMAPNIARQMVLDMNEETRAGAREFLCSTGALERMAVEVQCEGFTQEDTTEAVVYELQQRRSHFPFASNVGYRLREPKPPGSAPSRLEMDIYVNSEMPDSELRATLEKWQAQTNAWFNCQSGAAPSTDPKVRCPPRNGMPEPALEFDIRFRKANSAESKPQIKVSRCVRSELPADKVSDCQAARDFRIDQCMSTYKLRQSLGGKTADSRYGKDLDQVWEGEGGAGEGSAPGAKALDFLKETEAQLRERCGREIPPAGDHRNNRANSGHYETAIAPSTLVHEVGHLMGLPDEYKDPNYPFSPLGEHDSIMNNSNNPSSVLYPRHIAQMMAVKSCAIPKKKAQPGVSGQ
jgi:hypothetical protein